MVTTIETDLKEVLGEFKQEFSKLNQQLDRIEGDLTFLKVSQAEIKGELETFKAEEFLCLFSGYSVFFTSYSQALKAYRAQGTEAKTLWKSDKEKG